MAHADFGTVMVLSTLVPIFLREVTASHKRYPVTANLQTWMRNEIVKYSYKLF